MDNTNDKYYKPDWQPENAGQEFAVRIVKGVAGESVNSSGAEKYQAAKRQKLDTKSYVDGVLAKDRIMLARAITLVESNSQQHREAAREVIQQLLPHRGNTLRIGISGVPGAGKSTFIEALGLYLIQNGHKVAVLTVDPSSSVTKGSVLGDKTRMEKLSREQDCFIRPSPSGGALGGVTRKTRETITLCEAAGFDIILIETVGVGQNEISVRSMVDFFLLVLVSGAGDELQGIKKGVVEIADAILINKADGDNLRAANLAKAEYANALHYLQHASKGWETRAHLASSLTGKGIPEIWNVMLKFVEITRGNNFFETRRKKQSLEWVFHLIENELKERFYNDEKIIAALPGIKEKIEHEEIPPTSAAEELLNLFYNKNS